MTEKYKKRPGTGLDTPEGPDENGLFTCYDFKFRPAPNRYRRLFKEHPKSNAQLQAERDQSVVMQAAEFDVPGYVPTGVEISPFDWDEILVWVARCPFCGEPGTCA